jgi:hypothetical protein
MTQPFLCHVIREVGNCKHRSSSMAVPAILTGTAMQFPNRYRSRFSWAGKRNTRQYKISKFKGAGDSKGTRVALLNRATHHLTHEKARATALRLLGSSQIRSKSLLPPLKLSNGEFGTVDPHKTIFHFRISCLNLRIQSHKKH